MTDFFFIAGAQRCGTTYLYHLLSQHPQIEMAEPVRPEPKFFLNDALYARGLDFYKKTFFPHANGARVRGEKSTSYIEYEKVAQRIASSLPAARIVFILRNPVERAISNYRFSVVHGFETLPLEEAFWQEEQRSASYDVSKVSASPFVYLRRGRYMDYIDRYLLHFPRHRIKVVLFEQIRASARPLAALYEFLGVDPVFVPHGIGRARNASGNSPAASPHLDELSRELRHYLREYYRATNARLADFLNQDLTKWWRDDK